jgi:alkylation response protein AidB-like acyl-CoA dehydrogenase
LKGENPGIIGMMNKLNSTNIGHKVAHLAMEILGDEGLTAPHAAGLGVGNTGPAAANWVSHYMGTLGIAIAGGTANVQRNVIAERGLGLPRDSAANRGK